MKTNSGRFFEDYIVGQVIEHAVPRTVTQGERALYHALYPARHALTSSDIFAQNCGFKEAPLDDLIVFHTVFGKSVPDISLNAIANLGYAEVRFLKPVFAGDTLSARSEVIGVKQNSNGTSGVVYVRTQGLNQNGELVLAFVRWVMVRKGNPDAPAPKTVIPQLQDHVEAAVLPIPKELDFSNYNFAQSGEAHRYGDYQIGEKIEHVDGVTIEDAEHMMATRLWQNTAKVHFDVTARDGGDRLIYGGHIISLARALSFNGLANAQKIVAVNSGAHANPCFAGQTVRAWSEVLDKSETAAPGIGALRLRLVACLHGAPPFALKGAQGRYHSDVLLDLDYWALIPL